MITTSRLKSVKADLVVATQIMRRKKIILMNQKLTFLSMLEAQ